MINDTNLTIATNVLDQFKAINSISDGFLAISILCCLFIILIMTFSSRGIKPAILGGSAITSLIAVMFWALGLISFGIMIIPIILIVVSLMLVVFGS